MICFSKRITFFFLISSLLLTACTKESDTTFTDVNVPYDCSITYTRAVRWIDSAEAPVLLQPDSLEYFKQIFDQFAARYQITAKGSSLSGIYAQSDQDMMALAQSCCDMALGLFLRCKSYINENDCGPVCFALRDVCFSFRRLIGSDAGCEILTQHFGDLVYTPSDN